LTEQQKKFVEIKIDADGTDLEEFKQLSAYLKDTEGFVAAGNNLFLHSTNCGNGKTTFAVRFIQNYLDKIWHKSELTCRALFISVPRFLIALKDNISERNEYAEHIKKFVLEADVVIWDDIATKVGSEF
jgi:DNA replication protein DnaC